MGKPDLKNDKMPSKLYKKNNNTSMFGIIKNVPVTNYN